MRGEAKKDQRARFLVLRATVKDKPTWAIFHAIFYKEGEFWYGECLETDSVLVYDRDWEKVQWKLADAMFGDIQFARKHKFLEEAYPCPSRSRLARWRTIRKAEALSVEMPDPDGLSYKKLYPTKTPKRETLKRKTPFIPISSSPSYTYAR